MDFKRPIRKPLPGLRSVAQTWLVDLKDLWLSTDALGVYPAFAARFD
jgi:hypothetical protein